MGMAHNVTVPIWKLKFDLQNRTFSEGGWKRTERIWGGASPLLYGRVARPLGVHACKRGWLRTREGESARPQIHISDKQYLIIALKNCKSILLDFILKCLRTPSIQTTPNNPTGNQGRQQRARAHQLPVQILNLCLCSVSNQVRYHFFTS